MRAVSALMRTHFPAGEETSVSRSGDAARWSVRHAEPCGTL